MKTLKKITSAIVAALIFALVFTGCGGNDTVGAQSSLGLVVGAHKFNPKFTVSTLLNETIYNVARTYGDVSVTLSSGDPETVANWNLDVERKDVGEAKLKQIAQANTKAIVNEIAHLSASNAEVDTLSAISKEANNLSLSTSPVKNLIIYDSGLSTKGYLDFTKPNLILSDVKSIVEQLKDLHAIPNLKGINVTWYGLGQVRGEQTKLESANLYKLQNIWESVLKAGNPDSLKFIDAELTLEYEGSGLPEVSIVELPSNTLKVEESNVKPQQVFLQLTDEKLSFIPDTAEFENTSSASSALDRVAKVLKQSNSNGIYVIGSTASAGSHEGCITLSKKRAGKVKSELVSRGVTIKITSVGIGDTKCSLRTDDLDSRGSLIENQAEQNRAVYIISENSSTIDQLKEEGAI